MQVFWDVRLFSGEWQITGLLKVSYFLQSIFSMKSCIKISVGFIVAVTVSSYDSLEVIIHFHKICQKYILTLNFNRVFTAVCGVVSGVAVN
jgi:hypothetical protein